MTGKRFTHRFIAGAVCPECRAVDRIVVETCAGERRRRCVSCGFTDAQSAGGAVPTTRFTQPARGGRDDGVSPVKIVDPGSSGGHRE